MFVITFLIVLAAAMMVLSFIQVIYRIFISRDVSDKLYEVIFLAILILLIYTCYGSVLFIGFESYDLVNQVSMSNNLSGEILIENLSLLLSNINFMTIYLIAGLLFYGLTLMLIRIVDKKLKQEYDKPKKLWDWDKIMGK